MKKITIDDVIKNAKNLGRTDVSLVKKAYEFAKKSHQGQKRKSGEAYIIHPLYTAYYIAGLGLGKDTISAALLHDVIEDCDVKTKDLKKEFNPTVAKLVKGVTSLRHTSKQKISEDTVENLRRFFLVAAKDIRAVAIKLADRLHNAKTIYGLSEERQITYAQEIKYVYSTLSDYLGIGYFSRQFNDIAFKILNPSEYKKINRYLKNHHKERKKYIKKIIKKLEKILSEIKVKAEVHGREKSIYSFHKKIKKFLREGKIHSQSEYGRVYDNYGFRVLVDKKETCYKILGIIHSTWPPLNGEIEDYIANPKPNGYKSLHTKVFCDNNKIAEIQIRTYKMHEYNEFGPASHIAYKLSQRRDISNMAFGWIKNIAMFGRKNKNDMSDSEYRINVFKDNIFVLTPQNEVKQLPKGGTPVDFAYSVHTEVGNKCRGAKVNGKMVPLSQKLATGDKVEIIIDKNAKYPISKWLEFVVSSSTRSKIKQALRDKERNQAKTKGKDELNKLLAKHETNIKKLIKNKTNEFQVVIYKNNSKDVDSLLANIGFNLVSAKKVVNELFPKQKNIKRTILKKKLVEIEGSTQTEYTLAKGCKPRPGDDIIALTTITRGIRIHKKDCVYVKDFEKDRILQARWT